MIWINMAFLVCGGLSALALLGLAFDREHAPVRPILRAAKRRRVTHPGLAVTVRVLQSA